MSSKSLSPAQEIAKRYILDAIEDLYTYGDVFCRLTDEAKRDEINTGLLHLEEFAEDVHSEIVNAKVIVRFGR